MKDKLLKIFIILVIVFLIFCFITGISAIYKMIVFNKIFENMENKISFNNYYMKMTSKEDKESNLEIYYKNGIGKLVTSNGFYTWTDGTEAYLINEESKEYYKMTLDDLGLISDEAVASMIPGYSETKVGRMLLAGKITTSVKTEKVNGFKYYKIKTEDENQQKVIWLNKDTLLPSEVRLKVGNEEFVYNYEIKFENIKSEEVAKPNLEEYTLLEEN